MAGDIIMRGQVAVGQNFDGFTKLVQVKLLRRACKKAGDKVVSAAQAMLKRRTGALQDSVDIRTTTRTQALLYTVIGPRRGIKIPVRVVRSEKHAGKLVVVIPTRYAHLVERGHNIVDGSGKVVGRVAPVPFMRVAWAAQGGDVALATIERELQLGIANEKLTP